MHMLIWALIAAGLFVFRSGGRAVRDDYRAGRAARLQAAQKASASPLTPPQKARVRRQHAWAYWSREVFRGFPVGRRGLHTGWIAHKAAEEQARMKRDQALMTAADFRAERERIWAGMQDEIARREEETGEPVRAGKGVRDVLAKVIQFPARTEPDATPADRPLSLVKNDSDPAPGPSAPPVPEPEPAQAAPEEGDDPDMAGDSTYTTARQAYQGQVMTLEQMGSAVAQMIAAQAAHIDGMEGEHVDPQAKADAHEQLSRLMAIGTAIGTAGDGASGADDSLGKRHGGINEAFASAPGAGADQGFYQS